MAACEKKCADDSGCNFFSLKDTNGQCRGCRSAESTIKNFGHIVYALPASQNDADKHNLDVNERIVASNYHKYVDEWCTLPEDLSAGRYNYTLTIESGQVGAVDGRDDYLAGHGDAMFSENEDGPTQAAMARPFGDKAYVLTIVPVVKSMSTAQSGLNGGQEITITGTGFQAVQCTQNVVLLAGVPCTVTACSRTELTCTVANSTDTDATRSYPSTSGLHYRKWTDVQTNPLIQKSGFEQKTDAWAEHSSYTNPNTLDTTMGGTGYDSNGWSRHEYSHAKGNYYREEERGYFVAPNSGEYRWYISGDDVATVWLNQNDTSFDRKNGMKRVAWNAGATSSYRHGNHQISEWMNLTKGQRYPFQIRFIEWGGHDYFQAGVEIKNSDAHKTLTQYHRVNEIQTMQFRARIQRQEQRITVFKTSGTGTFQILGKVTLAADGFTKVRARSSKIEIASSKRRYQLQQAMSNVYRHISGTNCNNYKVNEEDEIVNSGTLTFIVVIDCNAVNNADGSLRQYPVIEVAQDSIKVGSSQIRIDGNPMNVGENMGFEGVTTAINGYVCRKPAVRCSMLVSVCWASLLLPGMCPSVLCAASLDELR